MKLVIKLNIVLFLLASPITSIAQVSLEYYTKLDMEALNFWYSDPNKIAHQYDHNISPKGDCFQIVNNFLFFTWYRGGMDDRHLMLSRCNLATKAWVSIEFPSKNTLVGSGKYEGAGNSHQTAALGICPIDETIHLTYDSHANPVKYRVSNKNMAFASDDEFILSNFSEQRDYFIPNEKVSSFTYPEFLNNDAGELVLTYRHGGTTSGDRYVVYYDGNSWSSGKLLVKGRDQVPSYNQYGTFTYQKGKMHFISSVRIKDDIPANQGVYYAQSGQRGFEDWTTLDGKSYTPPFYGLAAFDTFKVASPLPPDHNGMYDWPKLVISENNTVHISASVPGVGTSHYIKTPESDALVKLDGTAYPLHYGLEDGRIYSVLLLPDVVKVRSTPQGQNKWTNHFVWKGDERFDYMVHQYYEGKIYILAAEKVESDKRPVYFIILDIENIHSNLGVNPNKSFNNDLVKVYPSPASSAFKVELRERTSANIRIYNTNGQEVYGVKISDRSVSVATDNFVSGVYLVKIATPQFVTTKKIVIE